MPDNRGASGSGQLPCQNDFTGNTGHSVGMARPGAADLSDVARLAVSQFVRFDAPL